MTVNDRYDSLIQWYAELNGLDWKWLKAQMRQESGFVADAHSKAGAEGLTQFMPRTWREWADGTPGVQDLPDTTAYAPDNPEAAIRAQAAYMRFLVRMFRGDYLIALCAYNWGMGNVKQLRWEQGFDTVKQFLPKETREYVEKIVLYYGEYVAG